MTEDRTKKSLWTKFKTRTTLYLFENSILLLMNPVRSSPIYCDEMSVLLVLPSITLYFKYKGVLNGYHTMLYFLSLSILNNNLIKSSRYLYKMTYHISTYLRFLRILEDNRFAIIWTPVLFLRSAMCDRCEIHFVGITGKLHIL